MLIHENDVLLFKELLGEQLESQLLWTGILKSPFPRGRISPSLHPSGDCFRLWVQVLHVSSLHFLWAWIFLPLLATERDAISMDAQMMEP